MAMGWVHRHTYAGTPPKHIAPPIQVNPSRFKSISFRCGAGGWAVVCECVCVGVVVAHILLFIFFQLVFKNKY